MVRLQQLGKMAGDAESGARSQESGVGSQESGVGNPWAIPISASHRLLVRRILRLNEVDELLFIDRQDLHDSATPELLALICLPGPAKS